VSPTGTASGLRLGRRLGAGGEAEVFEVAGRRGVAFKRYLNPSRDRLAKLRLMIDHPPSEVAGHRDHLSMAWPQEIVTDGHGAVTGFFMPAVDLSTSVPVFQVYNPQSRRSVAPAFTWRYMLRTARNLAAIIDALHRSGYVIGDVNESNFLVTRSALVVLVDCDSLQVTDPLRGEVHPCPVAKPEFTAPEFQSGVPSARHRTPESDAFSLAILVHLLLLEGVHPFAGVWRGRGDPPDLGGRIAIGSPARRRLSRVSPPPAALSRRVLPPELRRLAAASMGTGLRRPAARPTAREWLEALDRADAALRACDRSPHHVFADHLRRCPWCDRIDLGLPDPFPGPTGQSSLTRRPPPWTATARRTMSRSARSGGRWLVGAAAGLPVALARAIGWVVGRARPADEARSVSDAGPHPARSARAGGIRLRWRRAPVALVLASIVALFPTLALLVVVAASAVTRSIRWVVVGAVGVVVAALVGTAAWSLGADGLASSLASPAAAVRAALACSAVAAVLGPTAGPLLPHQLARRLRPVTRRLPTLPRSARVAYVLWVVASVAVVVSAASPGRWWPLSVG
jgi:hypothetical protein